MYASLAQAISLSLARWPQDTPRRRPLVVSGISRLAQQLRQLGEVGGDAPGFVAGEQLRRRASGLGTALEIDVGERLTVGVHDHEACRVIASQKPLRIKCYAAP